MIFLVNHQVPRSVLPPSARFHFGLVGDTVTVGSLHSDSPDEGVREASYKVYLAPHSHQEMLLKELLNGRREMAQLCGFDSYAQRSELVY